MPRRKKRNKPSGHFCWCCGSRRPNEKFSGGGHGRHLCKDCSKLDKTELDYFQALRNLNRCVTDEGIIPGNKLGTFEQFLTHEDPRIRELAEEMLEEDALVRSEDIEDWYADFAWDKTPADAECHEAEAAPIKTDCLEVPVDDELPF